MSIVLHLMPFAAWERLDDGEPVANESLAHEGFIHCTDTASVMLQVANAFYANGDGDFVVLHVDTDRLTNPCLWEAPAHIGGSGEAFAPSFPHVYGPIDRTAVLGVQAVRRDGSGRFTGYGELGPSV